MSVVEEREPPAAEQPDEAYEKRVAPLELFFDLVFVFALTQITYLMSENPTWEGLGQGHARARRTVVGMGCLCVADELHRHRAGQPSAC